MAILVWRDDLSVGHPEIDNDHRRLIAIINDFQNTVAKWPAESVIQEALLGLESYARWHFEREEAIQAACDFPFLDDHRRQHAELLNTVADEIKALFVDKSRPITAATVQMVAELLKHWLIDHIIKSDLLIRDYLKKAE